MNGFESNCDICGEPMAPADKVIPSKNRSGRRRPIHARCLPLLRAEWIHLDSFACRNCKKEFSPDDFPFKYRHRPGGVGDGGGYFVVEDSPCPSCGQIIPKSYFAVCAYCSGGLWESEKVKVTRDWGIEICHRACADLVSGRTAAKSKADNRKEEAGISWLWIAIIFFVGIVLVLALNAVVSR
jgi:hypothetical protein